LPEASPPQNREQALDHTSGRPTNPPHAKVSVYDMALCVPGLSVGFRQGEKSRRARLARIPELSSNKRVQVARASADVETVDKYTQLGASGLRVSKIGIGTLAWGDEKCGFGTSFRESGLKETFAAAAEGGINFIDTAEVYGFGSAKFEQSSEHLCGRFAADWSGTDPAPVIGSKVFTIPWTNAIMGGGFRVGSESLVEALKGSVERVGRPLDLWSIHFPFPGWSQEKLMDALKEGMDLGLTKSVGVSNYNAVQLEEAHEILAKAGIPLACNQVKYNLLHRSPEKDGVMKVAEERGIKIVAYAPLAEGQLAGKTEDEKVLQMLKLCEFMGAINGGKSVSQVALNYLVCKGAIPIPGCKNAQQAAQHAGALGWELGDTEIETLDEKLDYLGFK